MNTSATWLPWICVTEICWPARTMNARPDAAGTTSTGLDSAKRHRLRLVVTVEEPRVELRKELVEVRQRPPRRELRSHAVLQCHVRGQVLIVEQLDALRVQLQDRGKELVFGRAGRKEETHRKRVLLRVRRFDCEPERRVGEHAEQ